MSNYEQIKSQIEDIKNETEPYANTSVRIASTLDNMTEYSHQKADAKTNSLLFISPDTYAGDLDLRFIVSLQADKDYSSSNIELAKIYNRNHPVGSAGLYAQHIRIIVDGIVCIYSVNNGDIKTGIEDVVIVGANVRIKARIDWDKINGVYDLSPFLLIDGNKVINTHLERFNAIDKSLSDLDKKVLEKADAKTNNSIFILPDLYVGALDLRFLISLRSDKDYSDKSVILKQAYNRDTSSTGGSYSQFIRLSVNGSLYAYRVDGSTQKKGVEEVALKFENDVIYALVDWGKLDKAYDLDIAIDANKIYVNNAYQLAELEKNISELQKNSSVSYPFDIETLAGSLIKDIWSSEPIEKDFYLVIARNKLGTIRPQFIGFSLDGSQTYSSLYNTTYGTVAEGTLKTGLEDVLVSEYGSSGISFYITVNWDAIYDNIYSYTTKDAIKIQASLIPREKGSIGSLNARVDNIAKELSDLKANGLGEDYDQSLNTTDDVKFNHIEANSISTPNLVISSFVFDFPEGSGTPPSEVEVGDIWVDIADNGTLKTKM